MGTLFALASALCYGISDTAGGMLSRRAHFGQVALFGQLGGLLVVLAGAPMLPASATAADWGWGALSGVGTGIAMVFLFRGIARGAMSVVVPISAVTGVALPVLTGVALLGERPALLAWLGIAVTMPALWLVSRTARPGSGAAANGLLAGVGIAVQYLALAEAGPDAGIWPVLAGRIAAVVVLLAVVAKPRPRRGTLAAMATGAAAGLALTFYLLATRQQLVVVAVVLSSLYPVIPVLYGITALRERLTRRQIAGLLGASAAVLLLTVP